MKFKLTERPRLLWKPSNSVKVRDGVILARLINQKTVRCAPDFIPRRVRAIARPRIGSGTTVPGATAWTPWTVSNGRQQIVVGFQVDIDTSSAGFTEIPCYFAWLQGSSWSSPKGQFLFASFAHISKVSIAQLTFNLWLPSIQTLGLPSLKTTNQALATEFLTFAQQQKLYVSWLGIQPFQKHHNRTEENYESA